jgi:hypothetical protein
MRPLPDSARDFFRCTTHPQKTTGPQKTGGPVVEAPGISRGQALPSPHQGASSNAPMSNAPDCGRGVPSKSAVALVGVPALTAGLPARR